MNIFLVIPYREVQKLHFAVTSLVRAFQRRFLNSLSIFAKVQKKCFRHIHRWPLFKLTFGFGQPASNNMYRQWLRTAKPEINCIYLTSPKRESNSINHATAHTRAVGSKQKNRI
jgi:hypothetical protein